jgi:predicted lipid-binding transport protein (Tim44 family)
MTLVEDRHVGAPESDIRTLWSDVPSRYRSALPAQDPTYSQGLAGGLAGPMIAGFLLLFGLAFGTLMVFAMTVVLTRALACYA